MLLRPGHGIDKDGTDTAPHASDLSGEFQASEKNSNRGCGMGRAKRWSAEQRFEIVLQSLRGDQSNVQICRRYQISEPTLYKWRHLFLQGARVFLGGSGSSVKQLAEENQRLKEMVVDLSLAYRSLGVSRLRPGGRQRRAAKVRPSTRIE